MHFKSLVLCFTAVLGTTQRTDPAPVAAHGSLALEILLVWIFPLIYDGFSPFITPQKIATCPCPAVVSQEKSPTWAHCEFSFLCAGKCIHSLGTRLPHLWRRKSAGFSEQRSRTVKYSISTKQPPLCCTGKGSQGSTESPKQNYSWGFPLCPTPSTPCRAIPAVNSAQNSLGFAPWEWKAISIN